MGTTSLLDIQTAIYNKLTSDAPLMALITGVYDDIPIGQKFPYVNIGESTENKFNTFDRQGHDVTTNINIYSDYEGFKEGLNILHRIVELLDYQSITLTENNLVYIRYDGSDTLLLMLDEGRTKYIRSRFRLLVQEV